MSEPLFTPRSGIGSKYKDSSSGKSYVFTSSGWKPASVDIQEETQDSNTFVVKPDEVEFETKALQGGATKEEIYAILAEQRKIAIDEPAVEEEIQTPPPIIEKKLKNPFMGMTKQQALLHAYNKGMTDPAELDKLEKLYDKLVPEDTSVVDEETMKIADPLRAEYFKRTGEGSYLEVRDAYKKIQGTSATGPGDLSLLVAYMKMIDPSTGVKEGELATATNVGSIPQSIVATYNKLVSSKGILDPAVRENYRTEARGIYQGYKKQQDKIDSAFSVQAKRYNIDPSLLMIGLYDEVANDTNGDALNLGETTISPGNPIGL